MFLGCPSVRTSVCAHFLFPQQLLIRLTWNFHIGVTTHIEYCNDDYDVIGHVVWQPC